MKATKAGIWMDHNHAYLIEFTSEPTKATLIESRLNHELKKPNLSLGEVRMHSSEQRELASYFKKLGDAIRPYQEIILFGPGNAHAELFNLLRGDHVFGKIRITTKKIDKLTQGQMRNFVRKHFTRELI